MTASVVDEFTAGALAALETFREELLNFRGLIENETEPTLDVVLDLLARVTAAITDRGRV